MAVYIHKPDVEARPQNSSFDRISSDSIAHPLSSTFCDLPFSSIDVQTLLKLLEQTPPTRSFGYVVTPNVDHVVRSWKDKGGLRTLYTDADLSLCDSRIISLVARASGLRLPAITGSDLTAILLQYVIDPFERVTIVGGDEEVVAKLARRYNLRNVRHHNPPMGFIEDELAVLTAAQFVERVPARFVFFCVGSPQQEMLAQVIKRRGRARGLGLCVGASMLFLSGDLQRAPLWVQRARLEWLYRLLQEPKRLWRRYLVDGPRILRIAAEDAVQRRQEPPPRILVSIVVPTFRRERLLARLLNRCCRQSGVDPRTIEIVVVDNSADARAQPTVGRAGGDSPVRIRYVHEPRPGISHARNRGIKEAVGDLVAFIDDDEVPSPGWLEALLRTQKTFEADAVLGPVRPVFEQAPATLLRIHRAFFTQSSTSATGTSILPNSPFPFRRTGCSRPLASNNALLVKSRCFSTHEPFDPALGLTGGEDTLFFTQLHRDGRKIVYCREALVHERIPKERLTAWFLLRRKFRNGQITASTCLRLKPPAYGQLLGWLAVGTAQVGLGAALAVAALPFNRGTSFKGLCMVSTGLGKLAFFNWMRERQYGARANA